MPRPLRVLYPFTGETVGGSHVSTLDLVRGLPDRITPVIAQHGAGLLNGYLDDLGLSAIDAPRVRLPREKSVLSQIPAFLSGLGPLTRFLREQRIDIVHTNDNRMHLGWALPTRRAGAAQLWHQRVPGRPAASACIPARPALW